jgi:iron complex outermembrane receptor protein
MSNSFIDEDHTFGIAFRLKEPGPGVGHWDIDSESDVFQNESEIYVGSLQLDWDLDGYQFSSITAYQDVTRTFGFDVDAFSPTTLVDAVLYTDEQFMSQEFQLSNTGNEKIDWTVGAYYFSADAFLRRNLIGLAFGSPTSVLQTNGSQDTTSMAAYAQATYRLTDQTSLTAGVRFTSDERELLNNNNVLPDGTVVTPPADFDNEESETEPTWRLALDHQISDAVMLYASYDRGFKSGVFVTSELALPPTDSETVDAYQVGAKMDLLDRILRVNVAGFYYDYSELQLQQLDSTGAQRLLNAAKAEIMGLEVELNAVPTDNLSVHANASWIPTAEYDDFDDAPFADGSGFFDASGNRLIRTPRFTAGLGGDYTWRSEIGDFRLAANYYYNSGWYSEVDNVLENESYSVVNANLTWYHPEENLEITASVENLTESKYLEDLFFFATGGIATPGAPRTFGLTARFKYE